MHHVRVFNHRQCLCEAVWGMYHPWVEVVSDRDGKKEPRWPPHSVIVTKKATELFGKHNQ